MSNASAIKLIKNYIDILMNEPFSKFNHERFKAQSNTRWAAREVLRYVNKHNDIPAIDAVENFAAMVDSFACCPCTDGLEFSIAYDTAMDILSLLIMNSTKGDTK